MRKLEDQMITVARIDEIGGACPFQIAGWTSDNRQIYVRYRGGRLKVYLGKPDGSYALAGELILNAKVGEDLDGWMEGSEVVEHTRGIIEWSDKLTV